MLTTLMVAPTIQQADNNMTNNNNNWKEIPQTGKFQKGKFISTPPPYIAIIYSVCMYVNKFF